MTGGSAPRRDGRRRPSAGPVPGSAPPAGSGPAPVPPTEPGPGPATPATEPATEPPTEPGPAPATGPEHTSRPRPGPTTGPDNAPDTEEVADLRSRVAELDERWRRTLADFDNLRKRFAREGVARQFEERAQIAAQWLPIIDNLDLALEHAENDPSAIIPGVRTVRDQALDVLAKLGFPRRADEGRPFDPNRHEAIATLPSPDAPAGTVLQVVRPGYGTDEHQLRPAAVVIAKGA